MIVTVVIVKFAADYCQEIVSPRQKLSARARNGKSHSPSEEGKCLFVLAGFWKLYEAAAFDYQSPIKNFGETPEVGPLEEEASRALATKPMAAMNLRYASEELVDTILRETGRRANLIAITCNELLKRLETSGRVIEAKHVAEALASREIATALVLCERLPTLADLRPILPPKAKPAADPIALVVADLVKRQAARPRTLKTLTSTIHALVQRNFQLI